MRDIGIGAKNKTFQLLFKGLKLSKFFIFGPLNKTHNTFLAHELKMRFKLLNFARKLFLMLLKKYTPPPLLWKIYLYEEFSPKQSIFIKNFMT